MRSTTALGAGVANAQESNDNKAERMMGKNESVAISESQAKDEGKKLDLAHFLASLGVGDKILCRSSGELRTYSSTLPTMYHVTVYLTSKRITFALLENLPLSRDSRPHTS